MRLITGSCTPLARRVNRCSGLLNDREQRFAAQGLAIIARFGRETAAALGLPPWRLDPAVTSRP